MKIGVTGYSGKPFDKDLGKALLMIAFKIVGADEKPKDEIKVVSGLTDLGVPAIAYAIAKERGWKTVGIACPKAEEFVKFPCDEVKIIGKDWGDESDTFLNDIDVLIRVGGGAQAFAEAKKAKEVLKIPVYEFDLPIKK